MAVADFDGTGDYIDCEPIDLTGGAFTLVSVFKREANGAWHTLASGQTSADAYRWALSLTNGDRLQGAAKTTGLVEAGRHSGEAGTGTTFTIQAADGYVIAVWSKPASSSAGMLSVYKGGAWTHLSPSTASVNPPGSISGGKVRLGRFEAASDDASIRYAAFAIWNGTALSQAQIETLDGGSATAWTSIGGGYTDLIEPGMNGSSARANWTAACPSRNGTLDATGFVGNGAIVTGDDPASGIYTVGAAAGTDATVTGVPAAAVGSVPPPTVSGNGAADVAAVPAAGLGDAVAPAVVASSNVTAPPALGIGTAPLAGNEISAEVVVVPASGIGALVAPAVAGGAGGVDATVTAVPAAAVADTIAPAVFADGIATTPAALGIGDTPPPAVDALGATVTTPAASAFGDAIAPLLTPAPDSSGTTGPGLRLGIKRRVVVAIAALLRFPDPS